MSGIWLVLPVKELGLAKQRLGPALSPDDRRSLMHGLVMRTFDVASQAGVADQVLVVTSDERIEAVALARGLCVLPDPGGDHSAAALCGTRHAASKGAAAVVTLASDLPLLVADDIRALSAPLGPRSFVIASDSSGRGTNAIAVAPPRFAFSFGPGSYRRHVAEAQRLGLSVTVVRTEGLAADLDEPADLERLKGRLPPELERLTEQRT